MDGPGAEPDVFAVSGGSYMAAALAMRRSFDPETGTPRDVPGAVDGGLHARDRPSSIGSGGTPATSSSRRSRDPRRRPQPARRARSINLFLAATALLAVVWVSIQLVSMLGLTRIYPSTVEERRRRVTDFRIDADLGNWEVWGLVPLVALVVAARADPARLAGGCEVRQGRPVQHAEHVGQAAWWRWSSAGRPVALGVALGWLLLVLGLPAAATGVAEAATQNQPTATVGPRH